MQTFLIKAQSRTAKVYLLNKQTLQSPKLDLLSKQHEDMKTLLVVSKADNEYCYC